MPGSPFRVAITTSREPSRVTRELVNDLANSLPGTVKVSRGRKSLTAVLEEAVRYGAEHVVLVWDMRGVPFALLFYDVAGRAWEPYALRISGVRMRRDFPALVARRPRARSAVIVDLARNEISDIFMEVFHYPVVHDLDAVRGLFDTVLLIRQRDDITLVETLGSDLGPRAPTLKIGRVIYRACTGLRFLSAGAG
jgi:U3 small nucleolar ribonucleoprotein protein IMP4